MEEIGAKRNPNLASQERFVALLLRALLMPGDVVIVDRPFVIMPDVDRAEFMINALHGLEEFFNQCFVLDYVWNEERYLGVNHETPLR
ncbi:MAG: hypothetical protein N2572_02345 [Syntrophales bacterium]|nr:hypothetical protein [Syntrophales bacterium]